MKNQRHRDFPILNKKGKYVGTISRRNLIGNAGKKLILVDVYKRQAQMHVRHWREQSADRKKVLWP